MRQEQGEAPGGRCKAGEEGIDGKLMQKVGAAQLGGKLMEKLTEVRAAPRGSTAVGRVVQSRQKLRQTGTRKAGGREVRRRAASRPA